ncbi:hypothetical protein FB451DRAFT_1487141 [Mycena latifolia]|nr:hypothetical protein FB451DRAFT_1487141 [Mycena latifolia]
MALIVFAACGRRSFERRRGMALRTLAACMDATSAMGNGRRKWCARRWRCAWWGGCDQARSEPGGAVAGTTLVVRQEMTRAAPATVTAAADAGGGAAGREESCSGRRRAARAVLRSKRQRRGRREWVPWTLHTVVVPSSYRCAQAGRWACGRPLASILAVMGRDVLRTPGGVGAVMGMRPRARVERGRRRGGERGSAGATIAGGGEESGVWDGEWTQRVLCNVGVARPSWGACREHSGWRLHSRSSLRPWGHRGRRAGQGTAAPAACRVSPARGAGVEGVDVVRHPWRCTAHVHTTLPRGGRNTGRNGRVRVRRMAEDDVRIYATSEKQESRECKEMRSVRKGSGGETHPYPTRRRPIRTAQVAPATRCGFASAQNRPPSGEDGGERRGSADRRGADGRRRHAAANKRVVRGVGNIGRLLFYHCGSLKIISRESQRGRSLSKDSRPVTPNEIIMFCGELGPYGGHFGSNGGCGLGQDS